MTAKTGSGAVFNNYVDPATNRLAFGNFCYDPSGNMVSDQNGGCCANPNYGYDFANRLVFAKTSGGAETYLYGADNKRISTITSYSSGAIPSQVIYIYRAAGELLSIGGPREQTRVRRSPTMCTSRGG